MKYVIAFDKFKGSLTALEACGIAAQAIKSGDPAADIVVKPLTDGGEGFCAILTTAAGGFLQSVQVENAVGEPVQADIGWVRLENLPNAACQRLALGTKGKLAIVEMAQAAGLQSLPAIKRNPWHTSTYGVGQMLQWAAKSGADAILLGLGGSATNDLGTGALQALGLQGFTTEGKPVDRLTPGNWQGCSRLDVGKLSPIELPPLRLACDVDNPLLGDRGATRVFAPQKGLAAEEIAHMETQAQLWAEKLACAFERPHELAIHSRHTAGAGAAGGIGFGLLTAFTCTEFISGADLVLEWLNLAGDLKDADWLLTGEGRFDRSSLGGKGPYALLQMAQNQRLLLCCGSIEQEVEQELATTFRRLQCKSISPAHVPLDEALRNAARWLNESIVTALSKPVIAATES